MIGLSPYSFHYDLSKTFVSEGYIKHFSKQKIDEFYYLVCEAQKKHLSTVFIDGWKIQVFSDEDFGDVDHLNFQGAAKFSTILNNIIENIEGET